MPEAPAATSKPNEWRMTMYEIKEFPDKHTKQFRVLKDGKTVETFRGKYAERQANDYVVSNANKGEI